MASWFVGLFSSSTSEDDSSKKGNEEDVQVITHEVVFDDPSIQRSEYWKHVMEPGFEFFIYERKNGSAKPTEISYTDDESVCYRKTMMEVTAENDSLGFLGYLGLTISDSPITYVSTQRKCKMGTFTITYENEFQGEWSKHIPWMKGVVVLKNSPTPENPNRFIQRFNVELKVNTGWNPENWLTRGIGGLSDGYVFSAIQKKIMEKANELPSHFLDFLAKEKFTEDLKREYDQNA
jgi:hypothetical protein